MTETQTDYSAKHVIAVDPGKLSGLSLVRVESDGSLTLLAAREVDETAFPDVLWSFLTFAEPFEHAVVCERFIINAQTARNSQAPWSLEMIGVTKYLVRLKRASYSVEAVEWQSPSDAKRVVTNEKLKALGCWHSGGAGHANDATRHAVLYLVRHGWTSRALLTETADA